MNFFIDLMERSISKINVYQFPKLNKNYAGRYELAKLLHSIHFRFAGVASRDVTRESHCSAVNVVYGLWY